MLAKRKSFIEKKSKKEKETHDTDFGNSEGQQGEDPGSSENEYCKKKKKMQTEHFRKLSCVGTDKERTTNRPKNTIQKCRSVGRRKGNFSDPIKCVS